MLGKHKEAGGAGATALDQEQGLATPAVATKASRKLKKKTSKLSDPQAVLVSKSPAPPDAEKMRLDSVSADPKGFPVQLPSYTGEENPAGGTTTPTGATPKGTSPPEGLLQPKPHSAAGSLSISVSPASGKGSKNVPRSHDDNSSFQTDPLATFNWSPISGVSTAKVRDRSLGATSHITEDSDGFTHLRASKSTDSFGRPASGASKPKRVENLGRELQEKFEKMQNELESPGGEVDSSTPVGGGTMPGKSDEKRPLREEGAAPSDASQFVTPVAGMTPLETALGGTERSPTEAPVGTAETAAPVLGGRSDRAEKLTVTHKSSLKQTSMATDSTVDRVDVASNDRIMQQESGSRTDSVGNIGYGYSLAGPRTNVGGTPKLKADVENPADPMFKDRVVFLDGLLLSSPERFDELLQYCRSIDNRGGRTKCVYPLVKCPEAVEYNGLKFKLGDKFFRFCDHEMGKHGTGRICGQHKAYLKQPTFDKQIASIAYHQLTPAQKNDWLDRRDAGETHGDALDFIRRQVLSGPGGAATFGPHYRPPAPPAAHARAAQPTPKEKESAPRTVEEVFASASQLGTQTTPTSLPSKELGGPLGKPVVGAGPEVQSKSTPDAAASNQRAKAASAIASMALEPAVPKTHAARAGNEIVPLRQTSLREYNLKSLETAPDDARNIPIATPGTNPPSIAGTAATELYGNLANLQTHEGYHYQAKVRQNDKSLWIMRQWKGRGPADIIPVKEGSNDYVVETQKLVAEEGEEARHIVYFLRGDEGRRFKWCPKVYVRPGDTRPEILYLEGTWKTYDSVKCNKCDVLMKQAFDDYHNALCQTCAEGSAFIDLEEVARLEDEAAALEFLDEDLLSEAGRRALREKEHEEPAQQPADSAPKAKSVWLPNYTPQPRNATSVQRELTEDSAPRSAPAAGHVQSLVTRFEPSASSPPGTQQASGASTGESFNLYVPARAPRGPPASAPNSNSANNVTGGDGAPTRDESPQGTANAGMPPEGPYVEIPECVYCNQVGENMHHCPFCVDESGVTCDQWVCDGLNCTKSMFGYVEQVCKHHINRNGDSDSSSSSSDSGSGDGGGSSPYDSLFDGSVESEGSSSPDESPDSQWEHVPSQDALPAPKVRVVASTEKDIMSRTPATSPEGSLPPLERVLGESFEASVPPRDELLEQISRNVDHGGGVFGTTPDTIYRQAPAAAAPGQAIYGRNRAGYDFEQHAARPANDGMPEVVELWPRNEWTDGAANPAGAGSGAETEPDPEVPDHIRFPWMFPDVARIDRLILDLLRKFQEMRDMHRDPETPPLDTREVLIGIRILAEDATRLWYRAPHLYEVSCMSWLSGPIDVEHALRAYSQINEVAVHDIDLEDLEVQGVTYWIERYAELDLPEWTLADVDHHWPPSSFGRDPECPPVGDKRLLQLVKRVHSTYESYVKIYLLPKNPKQGSTLRVGGSLTEDLQPGIGMIGGVPNAELQRNRLAREEEERQEAEARAQLIAEAERRHEAQRRATPPATGQGNQPQHSSVPGVPDRDEYLTDLQVAMLISCLPEEDRRKWTAPGFLRSHPEARTLQILEAVSTEEINHELFAACLQHTPGMPNFDLQRVAERIGISEEARTGLQEKLLRLMAMYTRVPVPLREDATAPKATAPAPGPTGPENQPSFACDNCGRATDLLCAAHRRHGFTTMLDKSGKRSVRCGKAVCETCAFFAPPTFEEAICRKCRKEDVEAALQDEAGDKPGGPHSGSPAYTPYSSPTHGATGAGGAAGPSGSGGGGSSSGPSGDGAGGSPPGGGGGGGGGDRHASSPTPDPHAGSILALMTKVSALMDKVMADKGDSESTKNILKEIRDAKSLSQLGRDHPLKLRPPVLTTIPSWENDTALDQLQEDVDSYLQLQLGNLSIKPREEFHKVWNALREKVQNSKPKDRGLLTSDCRITNDLLKGCMVDLILIFPESSRAFALNRANEEGTSFNACDALLHMFATFGALDVRHHLAYKQKWLGLDFAKKNRSKFLSDLTKYMRKGRRLILKGVLLPTDDIRSVVKRIRDIFVGYIDDDWERIKSHPPCSGRARAGILQKYAQQYLEDHMYDDENKPRECWDDLVAVVNHFEGECRSAWAESIFLATQTVIRVDSTGKGKGKGKGRGKGTKHNKEKQEARRKKKKKFKKNKKKKPIDSAEIPTEVDNVVTGNTKTHWADGTPCKYRKNPKGGPDIRLNKAGTGDDQSQFQPCKFFMKKGGCSKGKLCPRLHSEPGAQTKGNGKGRNGKGKGKSGAKDKRTQAELKAERVALMVNKPCPRVICDGVCRVDGCEFGIHDHAKCNEHARTLCPVAAKGKTCGKASETYHPNYMNGQFQQYYKCCYAHPATAGGAPVRTKKAPKQQDLVEIRTPTAPSDLSGSDPLVVDSIQCMTEWDPNLETQTLYTKKEMQLLRSGCKLDTGAGMHCAPRKTMVMETGEIDVETITGTDSRITGVSDIFPFGARDSIEASRTLVSSTQAVIRDKDLKGIYTFPTKDVAVPHHIQGPMTVIDRKGRHIMCYLQDGSWLLPNDFELAAAATARVLARQMQSRIRQVDTLEFSMIEADDPGPFCPADLQEPDAEPLGSSTFLSGIPASQRSALQKRQDLEDAAYDAWYFGPTKEEATLSMPAGIRDWKEQDETFDASLKRAITNRLGYAPKAISAHSLQGCDPTPAAPCVALPKERPRECCDLAVVYNAEGRPNVNHLRYVVSSAPFTRFPSDECELLIRTYGRLPEEADPDGLPLGAASGRRRVTLQVDGISLVQRFDSTGALRTKTEPPKLKPGVAETGSFAAPPTKPPPVSADYRRINSGSQEPILSLHDPIPDGPKDIRTVFSRFQLPNVERFDKGATHFVLPPIPAGAEDATSTRDSPWASFVTRSTFDQHSGELLEQVYLRDVPDDAVIFLGEVQATVHAVGRAPVQKLVRDLLISVQEMNQEIHDQTVQLARNSGESQPAVPVDDLALQRRKLHRDAVKKFGKVEPGKDSRAAVNTKVRDYVLGLLRKLRRDAADSIAFGGDPDEVQAANMRKTKTTGRYEANEFLPGHWFGDMIPIKDPGYTEHPDTAVVCLTEPDSDIIFVRPAPDSTGDSLFEALVACRALYGAVSVLSGDHAGVFTECKDLFAKHLVRQEAVSPEKQNRNRAELAWKRILHRCRARMNSTPKPPKRAWAWVLRWAEASTNIMSGAWGAKHGQRSWQHAIRNLYRFGTVVIVYHTAGTRNETTFGARGRRACYVAPSPCGGILYTEWIFVVGGGRRLAEIRVSSDWMVPRPISDYFEAFNLEEAAFQELESSAKPLVRRRRGRPAKVKMQIHEASTGQDVRSALETSFEVYDSIFYPDDPIISPDRWDDTFASMHRSKHAPTSVAFNDGVWIDSIRPDDCVIIGGQTLTVDEIIAVDVVKNLGMKKALSGDDWFGTGLTNKDVFEPAVYKEWKDSFITTNAFDWSGVDSYHNFKLAAAKRERGKYPLGIIDLNLHFLAGIKGFEHGLKGLAKKHGGDESDTLLVGKTKPKVRAVVNQENDIQTGKPRDGRTKDDRFVSMIPHACTTLLTLYFGALSQKSMLMIDESSAYPSVKAGGVPAVCRLPEFAWHFAMKDNKAVKDTVEKLGVPFSDLRVPAPKALYGRVRSGYDYEAESARVKRKLGWKGVGVRGLHMRAYKAKSGASPAVKGTGSKRTMTLHLGGEPLTVTGPGPNPIGNEAVSSYVDDDAHFNCGPESIQEIHEGRNQQPRTVEDIFAGASQLGTQLMAVRFTEAELGVDLREACRAFAAKRGIAIDENLVLEPTQETVTVVTRSQEPLKLKLTTEFEKEFSLTLELQDSPLPTGFRVSAKGAETATGWKPGRFAKSAPKWLGMSGYIAMHTHASDPLQYGQCCLGSITTRWSEEADTALLWFLGYIKKNTSLRAWSIWSSRDLRLGLMWIQIVTDASHAGHEDMTSHCACDVFLCGPNSRGHVEGHSARLKRKLGASSEAEAAGFMQAAKRSALALDTADGLLGCRVPVEVLLDAQVVVRQVAFGADAKVLASLRRFHALDLGQLEGWVRNNMITVGWWAGKNRGFTTDSKTKSLPGKDGIDDVTKNRYFMLKAFPYLIGDESERFETPPPK